MFLSPVGYGTQYALSKDRYEMYYDNIEIKWK